MGNVVSNKGSNMKETSVRDKCRIMKVVKISSGLEYLYQMDLSFGRI